MCDVERFFRLGTQPRSCVATQSKCWLKRPRVAAVGRDRPGDLVGLWGGWLVEARAGSD